MNYYIVSLKKGYFLGPYTNYDAAQQDSKMCDGRILILESESEIKISLPLERRHERSFLDLVE